MLEDCGVATYSWSSGRQAGKGNPGDWGRAPKARGIEGCRNWTGRETKQSEEDTA
jgi:hypothetical protein